MSRKVVVCISDTDIEVWTSLKKACDIHKWKYNTLVKYKLPTYYKEWMLVRCELNKINK